MEKQAIDGRNSASVDMVNIPLFTGFHDVSCMLCGTGFLPSRVCFIKKIKTTHTQ